MEKKKALRTFLSNARIAEIKAEINEYDKMLKADDRGNVGFLPHIRDHIQTPAEIKKEIAKRKEHLQQFSPQPFKGREADKAWAYVKKANKFMDEHRLTKNELFQKYPKKDETSTDFENAVKKQMAWQLGIGQKVERNVKHIMRRLDPQDPTVTNLERLRR